jgi:hypothetical protein
MSKSREQPVRVECMGGCGKHPMIRPSKIDRSLTLYGRGKCDGWEQSLKAWRSRVPYGAHVEWQPCGHADVGGFCGYRMGITTPEHAASFARARAILEAGLKEQERR